MKKSFAVILSFIMIFSVCTGCGKKSSKYLLDIDYDKYVTICDYKGIEAQNVVVSVSDEELKQRIDEDMYAYVTYEDITDRGAKEGDFINIDYKGSIDGNEAEAYSDSGLDLLLGEGFFFGEMEDSVIGMKAGETKKIDMELDENAAIDEKDIGKTLSMDVTLNSISVEKLPEYNEEFVKENTDYDTIEKYEEALKKEVEESKKTQYKSSALHEIMTYLYENSVFDKYPEELYAQSEEYYTVIDTQYAKAYEISLEEYYEMYEMDEEYRKELIVEETNYRMLISIIAKNENIDCTQTEIDEFVQDRYMDYGFETPEDFKEAFGEQLLGYEVIYNKVAEFLYDNAKLTDITEDEYLEQLMESDDSAPDEIQFDETELTDEMDFQEIEISGDEIELSGDEATDDETVDDENADDEVIDDTETEVSE
ncbi:MAG: FKBP-type peptidyl-prolyl cis-trans isomerase [Lachnospiraceae bacterium]